MRISKTNWRPVRLIFSYNSQTAYSGWGATDRGQRDEAAETISSDGHPAKLNVHSVFPALVAAISSVSVLNHLVEADAVSAATSDPLYFCPTCKTIYEIVRHRIRPPVEPVCTTCQQDLPVAEDDCWLTYRRTLPRLSRIASSARAARPPR